MAAAAAAIPLAGCSRSSRNRGQGKRVVVLGAGLAGLVPRTS